MRSYIFNPVGMDLFSPTTNAPAKGEIVTKTQPHGCPPNGTMGHTYVQRANGAVALVLLNSLTGGGHR